MTRKLVQFLPAVLMLIPAFSNAATATVNLSDDANELVNTILFGDVQIRNVRFNGGPYSSGILTGGTAALGDDKWVILTTGYANSAPLDNNELRPASVAHNSAGDSELEQYLIDSLYSDCSVNPDVKCPTSHDAAVLEFEFKTVSGNVEFEYIFASEEYSSFVGKDYNDAFALFVDNKNVALVPDSEVVVSINTVNNGPDSNGAGQNDEFFFDNQVTQPAKPITYNGLTVPLTAKKSGLDVAEWHTMKFVIADIEDPNWDSAVFIKADSFSVGEKKPDNIGADFLFAYMPNTSNDINTLNAQLHLTTQNDTRVTVRYPSKTPEFEQQYALKEGQVTIVDLPLDTVLDWTVAPSEENGNQRQFIAGTYEDNLVSVTSEDNVEFVAYMVNSELNSSDAAMGIPNDVLGTEYLVSSYFEQEGDSGMQQFIVYAEQDDTLVHITAAGSLITSGDQNSTVFLEADQTYTITLNHGEAFYGFSQNIQRSISDDEQVKESIAGTRIQSSKPVGVISGNRHSAIEGGSLDNVFEILPPLITWGSQFIATQLPNREAGSLYQVYTSRNNTTIYINGENRGIINKDTPLVTSIEPGYLVVSGEDAAGNAVGILGMQYMTDNSFGAGLGDPAMGYIVPTDQLMKRHTFALPGAQYSQNEISIVVPTADVDSVQLNGASVGAEQFSLVGSGFSWANLTLDFNLFTANEITSTNGAAVSVMGQGSEDGYQYPAGAMLESINITADLLAPQCAVDSTSANFQLNGTANDLIYSEDTNGDGLKQETESDLNGDGYFNINSGLAQIWLSSDATNLKLTVAPFTVGAMNSSFKLSLFDQQSSGEGTVYLMDAQGNITSCGQLSIKGEGFPTAVATVQTALKPNPVKEITVSRLEDIELIGSASFDIEGGQIVSYRWDIDANDGTDSEDLSGATASYRYSKQGSYTATLTVTDNDGLTATDSVIVHVENMAPVAIVTGAPETNDEDPGQYDYREKRAIRLDGSKSYDLDGEITNYHWVIKDESGEVVMEFDHPNPIVEITLATSGNYTVELTVTDNDNTTNDPNNELEQKQRKVDLLVFKEEYQASGSLGVFASLFLFCVGLSRRYSAVVQCRCN